MAERLKAYLETSFVSYLTGRTPCDGCTRATISFLGLWEKLHNPEFKGVDFDPLLKVAGDNAFTMSPTRWVEGPRKREVVRVIIDNYIDERVLTILAERRKGVSCHVCGIIRTR